jgi:excisionase family DNA binding protein
MPEKWITPQEAAELTGYHAEYIRRLARNGKIKSRKYSIVWQVERSSLLAYQRSAAKQGEKRGPKKGID